MPDSLLQASEISQSRIKSFMRGAAVDFGGTGLLMVLGFIITPITLSYLNPTSYGFWMTIQQVVGMLGLLEMGASIVVTQRVANPTLANDHTALSRFMSSCVAVQLGTAVIVAFLGFVLQTRLFLWFKISEAEAPGSTVAYKLMVAWFAVSIVLSLLPAILAARQKMGLANGINITVQLISVVTVVPFLAVGLSIMSFPVAQWLAGIIGFTLATYLVRKVAPPFKLKMSLLSKASIKGVLSFSLYNWLAKIAFMLLMASDNIIIASTLGAASVTPYLLTSRLAGMFGPNMAKLSSSSMAGFSELYATKNYERLQVAALALVKFSARVACFGASVVIFCSERFITLWVGAQYFAGSLFILLLGALCYRDTIIRGIGTIILASGDMRVTSMLTMVESLSKIVLVLFFIKIMHLGLVGVVLGQLIPTLLISGLYFPLKICKLTTLSLHHFFYHGILFLTLKSAPTALVIMTLNYLVPNTWKWGGLFMILFAGVFTNLVSFEGPVLLKSSGLPLKQRLKLAFNPYKA